MSNMGDQIQKIISDNQKAKEEFKRRMDEEKEAHQKFHDAFKAKCVQLMVPLLNEAAQTIKEQGLFPFVREENTFVNGNTVYLSGITLEFHPTMGRNVGVTRGREPFVSYRADAIRKVVDVVYHIPNRPQTAIPQPKTVKLEEITKESVTSDVLDLIRAVFPN